MTRYHVFVADNIHPSAVQILQQAGDLAVSAAGQMARADVLAQIGTADALLVRSATKVDAEMFAAASQLKAIARAGVGVDNVDLDEASRRGVVVMNTPDGNTVATAEFTIGLMLALLRHIPQGHASLSAGRWDRKSFMGVELRGKTLGIVGLGRVGRAVVRRAHAFEMRVLACDVSDSAWSIARAEGLPLDRVDLDALCAQSDVITLHPSLNDRTRGVIDAETLAKMKPGVYLINAARGALIVDEDLAAALRSGHVAGAALDVYESEPPPADHPLLSLPNVIHTPHLAASTGDAQIAVAVDAAKLVVNALLHGEYDNVCNPQVLEAR